jgi:hypothetical protein
MVAGSDTAVGRLQSLANRRFFQLIAITRLNVFEKLRELVTLVRQTAAAA